MTDTQFDQAKMDGYQLSDAEVTQLNTLGEPFLANLRQEFGSRTPQALINLIGSQLAHAASDEAESFYVVQTINDWFRVVALSHGGMPLQIAFNDELAQELGDHE